ncbi:hypothetical protein BB021_09285 [Elizabethkingia ursingii]|uniref:Uncharacterized protein n=1 Tax=Elizabethkingia ursingii TaxID=1756150 RepID=A0ABX3N7N3_9FLAO|nr:hypothetical protein BB021_09285 [Elizabethkingia ursingii]
MQFIFSEGITALIFWFFCIKAKEQIINDVSASIEKCQKKADRHIGIFCMPANSTKIKFRFPERWPKKLNCQAERREFVKQKFNVEI